jgi:hypothetical protein
MAFRQQFLSGLFKKFFFSQWLMYQKPHFFSRNSKSVVFTTDNADIRKRDSGDAFRNLHRPRFRRPVTKQHNSFIYKWLRQKQENCENSEPSSILT